MRKVMILLLVAAMAFFALTSCSDGEEVREKGGEPLPEITVVDAYLAVIDDIYEEDDALNEGISILAIDPTGSILTEEETGLLYSRLEEKYGLTVMEKTYEDLRSEGYINEETIFFKEGIKISIENASYDETTKTLTCDVQKWRSGLGAVGSNDVTAVYDGQKWTVEKKDIYMS